VWWRSGDETGRVIVVSPHLDDGVLGCGRLLAHRPGAVVITVFAGRPPAREAVTPWDAAAGFGPDDDVLGARRAEDHRALAALAARPLWLPFVDRQYGPAPAVEHLTEALARAIGRLDGGTVAIPLGLFHSDHRLAHEAALPLVGRLPHLTWLAYEDALYRRLPGVVDERVAALASAGLAPHRARLPADGHSAAKGRAIAAYASQLRALARPGGPGVADALGPERYWWLRP
jgi:LmbE family N-acetylglucosaminyl deacetylase